MTALLVLLLAAPPDARLDPPRTTNDDYHPWSPPLTLAEWEVEKQRIRERVLVSAGLWPMPERTPLNAVVHGKLDRGDHTIEKVFFASRPGLYVTGNLYRPKTPGPHAAVLSPHGHAANGRFLDYSEAERKRLIETGAETEESASRSKIQARCVHLARMGAVVFQYDMVGYADSPLPHRTGMNDARAALWLNNKLGLQLWNAVRALDFLEGLPDVDPARIGVTGASGGGTQTMLLGAVDDRPAAFVPAVMVSTGMQGGCQCENAAHLRIGLNNVALAAAAAPKPYLMIAADDWTIDLPTRGLPEMKWVWGLYDRAGDVDGVLLAQFPHNFNRPSRRAMYEWFGKHLGLEGPQEERPFEYADRQTLTVYDAEHPRPADELPVEALRERMRAEARDRLAAVPPGELPEVLAVARRVLFDLGDNAGVEVRPAGDGLVHLSRPGEGQAVPTRVLLPERPNGRAVVWLDGEGLSHLSSGSAAAVRELLDAGTTVISADLFLTGSYLDSPLVDGLRVVSSDATDGPAGSGSTDLTFGFNRGTIAERVRDADLVHRYAASLPGVETVDLVGTGSAGVWVRLAAGVTPPIGEVRAAVGAFDFADITEAADEDLLPGALRYGGLKTLGGR